jgi:hypothetical protein
MFFRTSPNSSRCRCAGWLLYDESGTTKMNKRWGALGSNTLAGHIGADLPLPKIALYLLSAYSPIPMPDMWNPPNGAATSNASYWLIHTGQRGRRPRCFMGVAWSRRRLAARNSSALLLAQPSVRSNFYYSEKKQEISFLAIPYYSWLINND